MYLWLLYFLVILVASLVVGRHLGRFQESCTEMTGMMAGMTIGMLGGFALGYGMTAAAGRDLFIGNLIGVLLGAALGGWFGRTGGLMGTMDGAMGGVMGGSMGAMIAAMVFPDWALNWTGVLFGGIYVVGSGALVALIESRAPEHEAIHWLLPKLALVRREPRRVHVKGKGAPSKLAPTTVAASRPAIAGAASTRTATIKIAGTPVATPATPMQDYYSLFGVPREAELERIEEAYLDLLADADIDIVKRADRALATLSNPERRAMYDAALAESLKRQPEPSEADARGDCCPPPKKKADSGQSHSTNAVTQATLAASTTAANRATTTTQVASVTSRTSSAAQPTVTKAPAIVQPSPNYHSPAPPAPPASPASPAPRISAPPAGPAHVSEMKESIRPMASGRGQMGKQKQGRQAATGAGKGSGQTPSGQAHRGNSHDSSRKGRHPGAYQQPGLSFSRRFAIGMAATMATTFALLLVVYVSTLNSGSSAQAAGYLNQSPQGAAYHVGNPIPSEASLESQAVVATVGADGVQTANLVLDQATSSYKPAAIKVKKGSPVRLNVSVEGSSRDCRSVVRLPALGAQALTQPGQIVPMNFTPSQAGVYEFNCPMQMMNPSYLVVTD